MSKKIDNAKLSYTKNQNYIGKIVEVKIDRKMGSKHPTYSRYSVTKTSNKNLTKVKIIYKKALKFENVVIIKINQKSINIY